MPSYHPTAAAITSLLTEQQCWFETFEHEPVRSSQEASTVRPWYTLQQGAKALIVRVRRKDGTKQFAMLVLPGATKFDNLKAKQALAAKDIRFATPEEVAEITGGIVPGGVPPFGTLFGLPIFADPAVFKNEKIVFNAGDRSFSVAMKSSDYTRLVKPTVVEIA